MRMVANMSRSLLPTVAAVAVLSMASLADAEPSPFEKSYDTDKKFGLGLMLGVPLGLSVKYLATPQIAFDVGAGAYVVYRDRTGTAAHGDILIQPFVAVEGVSFLAPLYFGVGARLLNYDDTTHVGVRVPLGIAFDFTELPFEAFGEVAFVWDPSITGDMTDNVSSIDANFLVGGRVFL